MKMNFSSYRHFAIGLTLLTSLTLAHADAEQDAKVLVFGPTGMQRDVIQVQMRFSEEITALGDNHTPDPATIICKGYDERPVGHWQNSKFWVADFSKKLPDDVSCNVLPQPVKTLNGKPVAMPAPWVFTTGGPKLIESLPDPWNAQNNIDNFAAFHTSIPPDPLTLSQLRCNAKDIDRKVRILSGTERSEVYAKLWSRRGNNQTVPIIDQNWTIAECGVAPLPYSAQVNWIWAKEITSFNGVQNTEDYPVTQNTRPMVIESIAGGDGSERPFGAFDTADPVDESTLINLHCKIRNNDTPVKILHGADKNEVLDRILKRYQQSANKNRINHWIVAQCGTTPWPNNAFVDWIWGKDIKASNGLSNGSDINFGFSVRSELIAKLTGCSQLPPTQGCDSRLAVNLYFSNVVSPDNAGKFSLRGTSGKLYLATWDKKNPITMLNFAGPFAEGETLKPEWSADFRDVDGRELKKADKVVIAKLPPYLGMVKNNAILQRQPDEKRLWPLAVRHVGKSVKVRSWQFGRDVNSTPALLDLLTQLKSEEYLNDIALDEQDLLQPFATSGLLMKKISGIKPKMIEQQIATPESGTAFVGIPINGYGVWVMEADSPVYRATLTNRFDAIHEASPNNFDYLAELKKQKPLAVVQLTNLNIDAHISMQGASLVWVTGLDSGKPLAGVSVEIWSSKHKLVAHAVTDDQGRASIARFDAVIDAIQTTNPDQCGPSPINSRPLLWIVARKGSDVAVMSTNPDESWNPVSDDMLKVHATGHTILDRTLFRPGETVSMQHLIRMPDARGWLIPPAGDGKLLITRGGDYQPEAVAEQPIHWNKAGSADSTWQFPVGAKLGGYQFTVFDASGQVVDSGKFRLEEFRIPQFDANLNLSTVWQGDKQSLVMEPSLTFKIGGLASEQAITLNGYYRFNVYLEELSFGDNEIVQTPPLFKSVKVVTDKHGYVRYEELAPYTTSPVRLSANMQFSDASGEVKNGYAASLNIWPKRHKVGMWINTYSKPQTAEISVGAFDENDAPLVNEKITVDVASADWLDKNLGSGGGLSLKSARTVVCTIQTDETGKGKCSVERDWITDADGWQIRASAKDASLTSEMIGKERFLWKQETTTPYVRTYGVLERDSENNAPALKVGDVAHFQVRAPFLPAMLLFTVEREGILTSQVHYLTQKVETIELPINANFAPGVTVVASLLRGTKQATQQNAAFTQMRAQASYSMLLDPSTHTLKVDVTPEKTATHPGQPVQVHVSVTNTLSGKPAAHARVTLVAVDQSLLELNANNTWELLTVFWKMRRSDVVNSEFQLTPPDPLLASLMYGAHPEFFPEVERSVLGRTLYESPAFVAKPKTERTHNQVARVQINGERVRPVCSESASPVQIVSAQEVKISGGETRVQAREPRQNFSTLAHWQTDLVLDENGKGSVMVTPPDTLTNWRVVAIAQDGTDKFGIGDSEFKTDQSVQIVSGLPLTVRSDDLLHQKITVRNTTTKPLTLNIQAQADVTLDKDLPFKFVAASEESESAAGLKLKRQLSLISGESRIVDWALAVPDGATQIRWDISATPVGGNNDDSDRVIVTQNVVPVVPVSVRESQLLQVDASRSITVMQPPDATSNAGGLVVKWQASMVKGAVESARAWMRKYPYSCMEQRSSKAAVSGDPAQWAEIVNSLPKYMNDGLVSYFPGTSGSEILTAYLLDLAEAYHLDLPRQQKQEMQEALRVALANDHFLDWTPREYQVEKRLTLQAAVAPNLGAAKPEVPVDLNRLPTVALIDWIRYVQKTKDSPERTLRLAEAENQLRGRYEIQGTRLIWHNDQKENYWWFMWTDDLAVARTALLAQQLSVSDPSWKEDATGLIQGLVERQKRGAWWTTTSNAWGVAAVQQFEKETERGPVTGTSSVSFDGTTKSTAWPEAPAVRIPWQSQGERGALTLDHQGTGAPWATVQVLAPVKSSKAIAHGVTLTKAISAHEQQVKGKWTVGDVIKVTLEMSSDRDLTWLVVNDPIPSGSTILNNLAFDIDGMQGWWNPSSVERGSDSYRGYYQRIWSGKFVTEYLVRLNNAGTFNFPPTRLEAMYAPEIFAEVPNNSIEVLP